MDKPLCRLCGHKHYGLEHVFDSVATFTTDAPVVNGPSVVVNKVVNKVANRSKDRHKNKEARKAYMRELMRKRRAK